MNLPRQLVLFGVTGRAALVYASYAGMIASLFCILASGALALYLGDAWFHRETSATSIEIALAFSTACVAVGFGMLSLAMVALLSRGAKPGKLAQESWHQAMDVTPLFHRVEYVVALVIAMGVWSLL